MAQIKKWRLVDPSVDTGNVKLHYTVLDQNISDVLNRQDLDDSEKLRLYQSALNKFLVNKQSVEREIEEPIKVADTDQKATLEQLFAPLLALAQKNTTAKVEETTREPTPIKSSPQRERQLSPSPPRAPTSLRGRKLSLQPPPPPPPRRGSRKRKVSVYPTITWETQ